MLYGHVFGKITSEFCGIFQKPCIGDNQLCVQYCVVFIYHFIILHNVNVQIKKMLLQTITYLVVVGFSITFTLALVNYMKHFKSAMKDTVTQICCRIIYIPLGSLFKCWSMTNIFFNVLQ